MDYAILTRDGGQLPVAMLGGPGPIGETGPAGDIAKAADRTALAAIAGPAAGATRFLAEAGREGLFVFSTANLSAQVTADPNQGVYVAPAADTTGATGAWVRKFDGSYQAKWWGVVADNSTNNAAAAQAAIDAVYALGGGTLVFPLGITRHSGLTFKNKIHYRGQGTDIGAAKGTILYYTGAGDGVVVSNPINSSTAANISVEAIVFKNATVNAGKGSFADTGSTFLAFRNCIFIGSDRGLILDQSELTNIVACDFEIPVGGTSGLWYVNGADRNVGALVGFTNRNSAKSCQFNGPGTAYGILDDGGTAHSFVDNNYNGCLHHIRAANVDGLKISGGEFESASAACVRFENTTLAGGGVGSCINVYIGDGAVIVPAAGQNAIIAFSLASIVLNDVFFGNTTAVKFNGTSNTNAIFAIGCHNGGGGATFDGRATNHWEVGYDGTDFKIRTNLPIAMSGTTALDASRNATLAGVTIDSAGKVTFEDVGGATFQSYSEHVVGSPYRYHSVVSKGGAGWQGAYRTQLSYNAGALFDAFTLLANTDGMTAAASVTGTINASVHYKVVGAQVVGARKTGWAVDTGTAKRTANATYSGTAEGAYTQATIQALMDAVRDLSQTVKALKDDLHSTAGHGLIGT